MHRRGASEASEMPRWLMVCTGLLLVVASCDRTEARVDERRVGIYGAVFDAISRAELGDQPEDTFEQVILNGHICGAALELPGHPELGGAIVAGYGDDVVCRDRLSPGEQAALLAALSEFPNTRFTFEPDEVGDQIADGDLGGIGLLLSVGPIEGIGDRVEVPASSFCGHLCARWMTFVVERADDDWEVTGTTGPFGMA